MIAALCEKYPKKFPHELAGYDEDDFAGMLLSLECASELENERKKQSGTPGSTRADIKQNSSKVKSSNVDHNKHVKFGSKIGEHASEIN